MTTDAASAVVIADYGGKWVKDGESSGDEDGFLRLLGRKDWEIRANHSAREVQLVAHFVVGGTHVIRRRVEMSVALFKHSYETLEDFDDVQHESTDSGTGFGTHQCRSKITQPNECRVVRRLDGGRVVSVVRTLVSPDRMRVHLSIRAPGQSVVRECTKFYRRMTGDDVSRGERAALAKMAEGRAEFVYRPPPPPSSSSSSS